MKKLFPAYLAAMGTVILWSMSYIWADRLLALQIPVEFFVPVRILMAGGLLFLLNLITRQKMRGRTGSNSSSWPPACPSYTS